MHKPRRRLMCAVLTAFFVPSIAEAADVQTTLGFTSHRLSDRPVSDPYATRPSCAGKGELATMRRYFDALRNDVATVEAWRNRNGRYPDAPFPLQRVGNLSPQYLRTRTGFGFFLKFRPFSAIRPIFDCTYITVASPAQLDRRGLPLQSPDGSAGPVVVFTTETGVYLVNETPQ